MAPAKAENSVAGKAVFKIWIKASLFNKGLLLLEFSLDESVSDRSFMAGGFYLGWQMEDELCF